MPSVLVGSLLEHLPCCPLPPLAPAAPLSLLTASQGGMQVAKPDRPVVSPQSQGMEQPHSQPRGCPKG